MKSSPEKIEQIIGKTSPLPSHVGENSLGTFNLGVSTAKKRSMTTMITMAMITAKLEMYERKTLGRNLWLLKPLRAVAMRKVPMNSRQLMKNTLGLYSQPDQVKLYTTSE